MLRRHLLGLSFGLALPPDEAAARTEDAIQGFGVSVLSKIPKSQRDAVLDRTTVIDASSALIDAVREVRGASRRRAGIVLLPPGLLLHSEMIEIPSNVLILGMSSASGHDGSLSSVNPMPHSQAEFAFAFEEGCSGSGLVGVQLNGANVDGPLGGIRILGTGNSIDDCLIAGFGGAGIVDGVYPHSSLGHRLQRTSVASNNRYYLTHPDDKERGQIDFNAPDCNMIDVQAYGGQTKLGSSILNYGIISRGGTMQAYGCWAEQSDCGQAYRGAGNNIVACNSERNQGHGFYIAGGVVSACTSAGDCIGGGGHLDAFAFGYETEPATISGCQALPDNNGREATGDKAVYHRYGFGTLYGSDPTGSPPGDYPWITGCRSVGHRVGEFHPAIVVLDRATGPTASRPRKAPIGLRFFDQTLGHDVTVATLNGEGLVTKWVNANGSSV